MIAVSVWLFGIRRPVVEFIIDGTDDLAEELAGLVEQEQQPSPAPESEA